MLRELLMVARLFMFAAIAAVFCPLTELSAMDTTPGADQESVLSSPQPVPRVDDPESDGWDTEVLSNSAARQLDGLAKLLEAPSKLDRDRVKPFVTADFSCGRLSPADTYLAFQDLAIAVYRTVDSPGQPDRQAGVLYRGGVGLAQALHDLAKPFAKSTDVRVKFKIFRIAEQPTHITSRQYFSMSGRDREGSLEQHAIWDCKWMAVDDAGSLRLISIEFSDYEKVRFDGSTPTLFSDCTESALSQNTCFRPQLMRGTYDWSGHIERAFGSDFAGFSGLAVADVNGDELEDVYVCQSSALPNRLFIQNADGTFTDRSASAGVDWSDRTISALFVDLDNDGDQDLVLGTQVTLLIMANDGSGQFSSRAAMDTVQFAYSLSAADYDHDGDLDVYACRYDPQTADLDELGTPLPYYDATNGEPNHLLRNEGDWNFTDVTNQTGMDVDNTRWSYAATWDDYDNDGDMDLYVANDYGRNCLYQNDGGYFVNVAEKVGVQDDAASGMSACWGDYNRDGFMDIYVANMFSAAGNRISFQSKFHPEMSQATKALVQRNARGNTLFANRGDGTFVDVTVQAGVTMGRWAWGSIFVDVNNDGWEDLIVANGFLTGEDSGDL